MAYAIVKPGLFRLLVIGSAVLLLVSSDRLTDRPVVLAASSRPRSSHDKDSTMSPLDMTVESTQAIQVQDIDSTRSSQDGGSFRSPPFQNVDTSKSQVEDNDSTHSPLSQGIDGTQLSPQFQEVDRSFLGQDQSLDVIEPREREGGVEEKVQEEEMEQVEEKRLWQKGYQREEKHGGQEEEEEEEEDRRQREQRKRREKEEEEEGQRKRFSLRQPDPASMAEGVMDVEVIDSSQESSGFFMEDGEDKHLLSVRLWEETDEVNDTRPDSEVIAEYHPTLLQTSSTLLPTSRGLLQEARQPNLTSLIPALDSRLEAGESELWEREEGQASGLPTELHPGSNLPTTSPDPLTPITSAAVAGVLGLTPSDPDPLSGLVKLHGRDVEGEDSVLTQNPTVPEVGAPPSRLPLQPGHTHTHGVGVMEAVLEEEGGESEEVERSDWDIMGHHTPLTTGPSLSMPPTMGFNQLSWDRLDEATPPKVGGSEVRGGATELFSEVAFLNTEENQQVVCVDWSNLAGRGYVILNTTENLDCEDFREQSGPRMLELVETVFSRRMNSPQGSWLLSLSKTPRHDHQLIMTLATSEHGVIATKDVLLMLGEIRRGLHEVGIQNYSAANTCHSRQSQMRSDYGKLFVVLVIIGSVCMVIITSGLIYICWQRRLPKTKTMSRGEELHFVENGCHDNPTLDVTSDSQPEMQEKKPSTNGLTGDVVGSREEGSHWQVLVNHPGREEEDDMEEDTHL